MVLKYRVNRVEDNRILEEDDVMARKAGEIDDGDLVENENVDDEIEGSNYAFLILLNMIAHGEALAVFGFHVFFSFSVTLMRCVTLKFCTC